MLSKVQYFLSFGLLTGISSDISRLRTIIDIRPLNIMNLTWILLFVYFQAITWENSKLERKIQVRNCRPRMSIVFFLTQDKYEEKLVLYINEISCNNNYELYIKNGIINSILNVDLKLEE